MYLSHPGFWKRAGSFLRLGGGMLVLGLIAATLSLRVSARGIDAAVDPSITVRYYGQTVKTTCHGETVGELLSRLGLRVDGEDTVSHAMEAQTRGGMEVRIDRFQTARERYTVTVPHDTTRCSDPSLAPGTQAVLTAGADGELLRTADVTYRNGEEIGRQVLSETLLRRAVTEIIGVGTGEEAPDPGAVPIIQDGFITLPSGEVLTYTRTDQVRATAYTHTDAGCDLVTATGTTVHWGTVAVDPRFIPYGTRMFIMAEDGSYVYGIATAEDCGGDIKGDRMDLYMPTYEQCMAFGRRRCTIYFLG